MEKKMGQKHSLSRIRIRGSPLLKYHTNRRKKSLRHTPASQRPKDGEQHTHTHEKVFSPSFFLSFLGVCGCCCALVVKMCVWSIG